jgi:hypothetical protein
MTKMTRAAMGALMATLTLAGVERKAFAGETAGSASAMARVRSTNPAVAAVISAATEQSATFKRLVATINGSDGLVYVDAGNCRHGVRACLVHTVTVAGRNRILHILVDARLVNLDLMESIGHELRHAVEVLSDPSVRSNAAIYFFYTRAETTFANGRFETEAAIAAGDAVRAEARHAQAQR